MLTINLKSNNLVRKLQKIRIFSKTGPNFRIFSSAKITGGSVIAQTVKYLVYHRKKTAVAINCKINITHITTIIAENTENLLNSVFNTIENTKLKIVRNSHLLSHKTGIFSSAMAIILQTSVNCSYAKTSKQQLTAHISIVKVIAMKCYKHTLSSCKRTHSLVL